MRCRYVANGDCLGLGGDSVCNSVLRSCSCPVEHVCVYLIDPASPHRPSCSVVGSRLVPWQP